MFSILYFLNKFDLEQNKTVISLFTLTKVHTKQIFIRAEVKKTSEPTVGDDFFHLSPLSPAAVRGQTQAPDASSGSDARRQNVLRVHVVSALQDFYCKKR